LLKKGVPIQLYIVGKGSEEARLKRFCRESGLEQASFSFNPVLNLFQDNSGQKSKTFSSTQSIVNFMGWQIPDQIKNLYTHSDIFILPSVVSSDGDRDGIPNVVLEAMSVGVPVISTSVSGIPEVIQNGFDGLLVPERDSEQLANAISTLVSDEQLRNVLVENACKTIREKFDSNQCNHQLIKLFNFES